MPQARLVLHAGLMKSGTSFLQSRLFASRDALLADGTLLPGREWRDQVGAVHGLLHGGGRKWTALAAEVDTHPGASIVSVELLAAVRRDTARRVVESVRVPVEVVLTARDLNRAIPAMWQESVQNGQTWRWDEYVAAAASHRPGARDTSVAPPPAGAHFWRHQNLVRILRTWTEAVGPSRVTLVTVPPPGAPRDVLWRRFAEAVGGLPGSVGDAAGANESLGAASAEVMRRLNEVLGAEHPELLVDHALRKRLLSKTILAARRDVEPRLGLRVAPWVEEQSELFRAAVAESGVRVIGELTDLAPVEVPGSDLPAVPEDQVAQAAVAAVGGLLAVLRAAEAQES